MGLCKGNKLLRQCKGVGEVTFFTRFMYKYRETVIRYNYMIKHAMIQENFTWISLFYCIKHDTRSNLLHSIQLFFTVFKTRIRGKRAAMDIILKLKEELNVEKWQVEAAVKLIDEGNTIPFISRYRKEVTGSLNDEVLRNLNERLGYLRNLEEKKEQVLSSIEEQGKLTEELREKILAAETMVTVDDLYLPYRPKRKTRASVAREKGLDALSNLILAQETEKQLLCLQLPQNHSTSRRHSVSWHPLQC